MPSDVNSSVDAPHQICSFEWILVNVWDSSSGSSLSIVTDWRRLIIPQRRAGIGQRLWTLMYNIWVFILLNMWLFSPWKPRSLGCLEKVKVEGLGKKSSLTTILVWESQVSESVHLVQRTGPSILRHAAQPVWDLLPFLNLSAEPQFSLSSQRMMSSVGLGEYRFTAQGHCLSSLPVWGSCLLGRARSPDRARRVFSERVQYSFQLWQMWSCFSSFCFFSF